MASAVLMVPGLDHELMRARDECRAVHGHLGLVCAMLALMQQYPLVTTPSNEVCITSNYSGVCCCSIVLALILTSLSLVTKESLMF
jgi:hypothetical protein